MNPTYLDESFIPDEEREKVQQILWDQMSGEGLSGKSKNILDRIFEGRIKQWRQDCCLMEQTFVKPITLSEGKQKNVTVQEYVRHYLKGFKDLGFAVSGFVKMEI